MTDTDTSPAIDHLARTIASALARTLSAYLPVETRSVEARLDALERNLAELDRRLKLLGESMAHSHESNAGWDHYLERDGNRGEL